MPSFPHRCFASIFGAEIVRIRSAIFTFFLLAFSERYVVRNYDEDADFRKRLSGIFRRVTEPTLSCAGFEGEGYRFYSLEFLSRV